MWTAGAAALGMVAVLVLPGAEPASSETRPNGKIAFYTQRNPSPEIFLTNPSGSSQAGFLPPATGYFPSFSPSGRRIAYQSSPGNAEIVVMRANGEDRETITNEEGAYSPSFGKGRIAYTTEFKTSDEIVLIKPNGTGRRRLTENARDENNVKFTPDGKRLIYMAQTAEGNELFSLRIRTGRSKRLTHSEGHEFEVAVSPSGRRIAFDRLLPGGGNYEIYIARIDGTHARRLTTFSGFDAYPSFSPNGRKLAFVTSREGDEDIAVMKLRTRAIDTIVSAGADVGPSWGVRR